MLVLQFGGDKLPGVINMVYLKLELSLDITNSIQLELALMAGEQDNRLQVFFDLEGNCYYKSNASVGKVDTNEKWQYRSGVMIGWRYRYGCKIKRIFTRKGNAKGDLHCKQVP